jgi:alcohol dehydrogenase
MPYEFYLPTKLLYGAGCLSALGSCALPGRKALLVTSAGQSAKRHGYLGRVKEQLTQAGVRAVLYDQITPNPTKAEVMAGAALCREEGCDFVLGLGGGSSIDAAKAISVMARNPGDYWDYVSGGTGKGKAVPNAPLPVVAVTTTAGTGTEADPWTVTTNEETQEKIGFGYEKTFPVLSVVDPELMVSVPPRLTAYQGFDALFHSTEGYLNRTASPISDLMALEAIRLIGKSLPRAVRDGADLEARGDVALANTLSGMVETLSGCISEHSIAHAMSAYHPKLPHGAALIAISKAYYQKLIRLGACRERMAAMARALGKSDAERPEDFLTALDALQKECSVDGLALSSFGMSPEEFPALTRNARETMGGLFEVDPVAVSDGDVLEILSDAFC